MIYAVLLAEALVLNLLNKPLQDPVLAYKFFGLVFFEVQIRQEPQYLSVLLQRLLELGREDLDVRVEFPLLGLLGLVVLAGQAVHHLLLVLMTTTDLHIEEVLEVGARTSGTAEVANQKPKHVV